MRSDARRNRDAVLAAGARLLAARPAASMQEVADASGLGRATVYRHFPTREDLVAALLGRVGDEVAQLIAAALAEPGPAPAVLRRLATDAVALGRRWRFLQALGPEADAELDAPAARFAAWVAGAQGRGELRAGVDPAWIGAVTRAVLEAAVDAGGDPRAAGREAGETLVRAFEA